MSRGVRVEWDPAQYGRYTDERGRPFADLVARIAARTPRHVVDLGCGPGNLTALLAARWPRTRVEGLDSSQEMIAAASSVPRVTFRLADMARWQPCPDTDVVVSSAALQWVPGHVDLLRAWAAALRPGAWLAWQVPGNFASPSHSLLRSLAESPRWRTALGGVLRHHDFVASSAEYTGLLLEAGFTADTWETTYLHVLAGPDPVLEWMRGTGLRPVLAALSSADAAEFEASYSVALRAAYPATPHGTILPFRRIFAVGRKQ
jgi:trans-aconitate 2-methyltransferase